MNQISRFRALGVVFVAVSATIGACNDPFGPCTEGFDCPGDDEGPKSGGASNSGGKGSTSGGSESSGGLGGGGVSRSGGVGNVGGTTAHTGGNGSGGENLGGACGDSCTEEAPHCLEDEATCVECLKHSQCEDEQSPICSLSNTCERCKSDGDCKDVLGLEDTPVCVTDASRDDYGSCVGCLDKNDCGGAICDPPTWTCIPGTVEGGKGLCDPCIDDRECKNGQLCIEMTYDDPSEGVVGSFCLWRRDAGLPGPNGTCGINSRPYAEIMFGTTSANNVVADVCTLRTTTCPALKQHASMVDGCEIEFNDDPACGAEGFNDGKCRLNGASEPRCTYPCLGTDPQDCPQGSSCIDTGSEKYCSL